MFLLFPFPARKIIGSFFAPIILIIDWLQRRYLVSALTSYLVDCRPIKFSTHSNHHLHNYEMVCLLLKCNSKPHIIVAINKLKSK